PRSIGTPQASSRSALPQRLDTARLPCFATDAPAPPATRAAGGETLNPPPPPPAATRAAAVETLNVPAPSPPVPQVSRSSRHVLCTRTVAARTTRALPSISATVSPFTRSAVREAPAGASD